MAVRFPRQGNPMYPLPPDYPTLSEKGKRLARLNALSLQETPDDLVMGWSFFRRYYLEPKEAEWYKRWRPSPPLHYVMVRSLAQYSLNAWAAPRSFSKTTVVREVIMYLMLTRNRFSTTLVQATDRKTAKSLAAIKRQLEVNPLILADFGELKGRKGTRPWSTDLLELPNGSMLEGLSIRSTALRGERPDLLVIDDPEYDDETASDPLATLEEFDRLLFKTLMPMMEEGTSTFWIGTMISRRSFLWQIVEGDDPRFRLWNRQLISILDNNNNSVWPEKWDRSAIEDLRSKIGESEFQSEYMNRPGSSGERILKIHPILCTYTVDGTPEKEESPLISACPIVWKVGVKNDSEIDYVEHRMEFGRHISNLYRMMTVDYARKQTRRSDYSCAMVMGFDREDTLWVLDGFHGKVGEDAFMRIIWDLAQRWQVRVIGSEAVSVQEGLTNRLAAFVAASGAGQLIIPRVVPIRYVRRMLRGDAPPSRMSKPERIAGLEWRFNTYRIRLPWHRKTEPLFRELYHQIEYFTMDMRLLEHDDALDTLAMHQHLLRRQGASKTDEVVNLKTPAQLLQEGELLDPKTGVPHMTGLMADELTSELVSAVRSSRYRSDIMDGGEFDLAARQKSVQLWKSGF